MGGHRGAQAGAKLGLQLNPSQDCVTGNLLHKSTPIRSETWELCLVHRNRHRKAAKMERQRSRNHMREQKRYPEIMESSNLTDAEFKTLIIKMLNELRGNVDDISENFNKDIKHKNGNGNYERESVGNEEHII